MSEVKYQCSHAACEEKGKLVPSLYAKHAELLCLRCRSPLEPAVTPLSPSIERAIQTYPYSIALPLQKYKYAGESSGLPKLRYLSDAFTGLLKFQGLILLTEYLESDFADEEINYIIEKKLNRPLDSNLPGNREIV